MSKSILRRKPSVVGVATMLLALLVAGVPNAPAASGTPATALPVGLEALGLERAEATGDDAPPPPPVGADGVRLEGSWDGPWTFRNNSSNKCMDILGASKADGAKAVQYTCVPGGESQKWYLWLVIETLGANGYRIGNSYSGKCLIPINSQRGGEVVQWPCSNAENRIWWTDNSRFDTWRNDVTGYYLEVAGASASNFARIVSWSWHGRAHQRWALWDA